MTSQTKAKLEFAVCRHVMAKRQLLLMDGHFILGRQIYCTLQNSINNTFSAFYPLTVNENYSIHCNKIQTIYFVTIKTLLAKICVFVILPWAITMSNGNKSFYTRVTKSEVDFFIFKLGKKVKSNAIFIFCILLCLYNFKYKGWQSSFSQTNFRGQSKSWYSRGVSTHSSDC